MIRKGGTVRGAPLFSVLLAAGQDPSSALALKSEEGEDAEAELSGRTGDHRGKCYRKNTALYTTKLQLSAGFFYTLKLI